MRNNVIRRFGKFNLQKIMPILYSNTNRILKKVINQDVSGCKDIETPASQLPKVHEISSHWQWKSVGFFKTIF